MKKLFLFVSFLFLASSAFAQQPYFFNTYYYGNPQYQSIYAGTPGVLWGNSFLSNLWQTYNSTTAGWQAINAFTLGSQTSNIYGTASLAVSNLGTVLDSANAVDTVTLPSTTYLPNGAEILLKDIAGTGATDTIKVNPGTNAVGTAQKVDGSTAVAVAINTNYAIKKYFVYKGNWYTK